MSGKKVDLIKELNNKSDKIKEINDLVDSLSLHRKIMNNCADKIWEDSGKLVIECLKLIEKHY